MILKSFKPNAAIGCKTIPTWFVPLPTFTAGLTLPKLYPLSVFGMRRYNLGGLGEPHQVEAALLWLVEKQFEGVLTREMRQAWVQFCQWLVLLSLVNTGLDES